MPFLQVHESSFTLRKYALAVAAFSFVAFMQIADHPAQAQFLNQLKDAAGLGQGGSGGGPLGGLGVPSVTQASPSNIGGILQYCIQNNYLSGGSASSIKNSIVSKLMPSQGTTSRDFLAGNNGMLQTGQGQNFSLAGGGLKEELTRKVCDLVLQHAKALL